MYRLHLLVVLFIIATTNIIWAQHEPKAWVIGFNTNAPFTNPEKIGGNFQVNFAYNCYTTFINEISVFPHNNKTAVEISSSVNSILNNFKQQRFILTGGIGLSYTSVSLTDQEIKDSFLSISGETNQNHISALFKIRGLYQFKPNWNFVTSINVKTLASDFINFSAGVNYEFPYRR